MSTDILIALIPAPALALLCTALYLRRHAYQ